MANTGTDRNTGTKHSRHGIGRLIAVVAIVAVAWGAWYVWRITSAFDGERPAWVYIPRDATPGAARDSIVSALGAGYGGRVASLWNGNVEVSHGAYRVDPGERAWRVARRIGKGRQTPVKVTFNNMRTFGQLASCLSSRMDFCEAEFDAACAEAAKRDTLTSEELQAQFLPDTYEVYWSAAPGRLIEKIRNNYNRFWTRERRDKAAALGLTPFEVSVLASIVEEESNRRDERPNIARLYLNRLHRGMLLQADPTVKFASGDFAARRITSDMLDIVSPYNTYRVHGLPPGVIRLPDSRTLDDVLNAPQHNYIYMCARPDGSGYHDFTTDYSAHLANARAYRRKTFSGSN